MRHGLIVFAMEHQDCAVTMLHAGLAFAQRFMAQPERRTGPTFQRLEIKRELGLLLQGKPASTHVSIIADLALGRIRGLERDLETARTPSGDSLSFLEHIAKLPDTRS